MKSETEIKAEIAKLAQRKRECFFGGLCPDCIRSNERIDALQWVLSR